MSTLRILYAIQGTGNGHISRAIDIIPILQKKGELDILISGTQAEIELPYPIKYRFRGLSFIFGKRGGVDLAKTFRKGNLRKLHSEIKRLPVHQYDMIISDFEPVSAWACHIQGKDCISLSHQAAVLHPQAPKPKKIDMIGLWALKKYAPTNLHYGFHFKPYGEHIFTPIIRKDIRALTPLCRDHYTVYLPAYSDKKIIQLLSYFPSIRWEVFSKHSADAYQAGDIHIQPIENRTFVHSLATATGILCGAGFETPAEALYLQKKLLVIPMKNQYEQQCNAAALQDMGIPVIPKLHKKHLPAIQSWIHSQKIPKVHYPDNVEQVIDTLFQAHLVKKRTR